MSYRHPREKQNRRPPPSGPWAACTPSGDQPPSDSCSPSLAASGQVRRLFIYKACIRGFQAFFCLNLCFFLDKLCCLRYSEGATQRP